MAIPPVSCGIKVRFLPEAVINFCCRLSGHTQNSWIFLVFRDAVDDFTFDAVHITGPIVDLQKLRWLNGQYIRSFQLLHFFDLAKPFLPDDFTRKSGRYFALNPWANRKLNEIESLTDFFTEKWFWDSAQLLKRADVELVTAQLQQTESKLSLLPSWSVETIEDQVRKLQEDNDWHKTTIFHVVRYVTTGKNSYTTTFWDSGSTG